MRKKFAALGYPEDGEIPGLYQRLAQDSGTLYGAALAEKYEEILEKADLESHSSFDLQPKQKLEVIGGDEGAFYSAGSLDGSRPGRFFVRTNGSEPVYKMKSLAYHEGIPGHHFQISLAQEADIPLFRNLLVFDGYAEGWALYAEYLAAELGWYKEDPYGDLGRLQYEALRACRMVADTGVHTKGWSYNQALNFLVSNSGIPWGFAEYEVLRYISYPAQATAYMTGKIEILRMKDMAKNSMGKAFDLREFHNVVLRNGSMPLNILERVIKDWIKSRLNRP
jgi:uncharacterized protein (DUF885 family)